MACCSLQQAIPPWHQFQLQPWHQFQLQFRKLTAHLNADALSHLPPATTPDMVPDPPEVVLLMEHLDSLPVCATDFKKETNQDPVLSHVLQIVLMEARYL